MRFHSDAAWGGVAAAPERLVDDLLDGPGLGLSIVKKLAELQGGRVAAASEGHGRGATFTVTLPLAPPGGSVVDRLR